MNVENTSMEGVTDIKVEIKVEHESDDETDSERDLYTDHVIKEEMVDGPVVLQVVDVTYCPEDVPVPKKPKLETTDEETDQVKPEKGIKKDNTEGIILNVDFKKTNTTSRNTKQTNHKCNQTPGLSENVFICNECGEKFGKKCELTEHVTCHQKKYHCDFECKDRSSNISIHLHAHTGEKPYSCSHCGYKCKHKGHLFTHLLIHTGEKPYTCSHCDYKCKQKGHLSRHLRIHSGENPYSCSHCDYKCKQKGNLSRHLRIHTDHTAEKPYSCSQCDYKCKQNSDLSKHIRTHTSEKPYSCSYCDYKCRQKSHLSAHSRIHTGEKPYSCSYCDYKCKQKSHLSSHSRIHTGHNKHKKKTVELT